MYVLSENTMAYEIMEEERKHYLRFFKTLRKDYYLTPYHNKTDALVSLTLPVVMPVVAATLAVVSFIGAFALGMSATNDLFHGQGFDFLVGAREACYFTGIAIASALFTAIAPLAMLANTLWRPVISVADHFFPDANAYDELSDDSFFMPR